MDDIGSVHGIHGVQEKYFRSGGWDFHNHGNQQQQQQPGRSRNLQILPEIQAGMSSDNGRQWEYTLW